jgi:hypothetical protein
MSEPHEQEKPVLAVWWARGTRFIGYHMMRMKRGLCWCGLHGTSGSYRYVHAKERKQGRHPEQQDPASLIEHADVRRMLPRLYRKAPWRWHSIHGLMCVTMTRIKDNARHSRKHV